MNDTTPCPLEAGIHRLQGIAASALYEWRLSHGIETERLMDLMTGTQARIVRLMAQIERSGEINA